MRTKPHPITWVGVVIRRWHNTNPNGDPNYDHNPNPNSPNWTAASAEPFANKFASRRSTESVLRCCFVHLCIALCTILVSWSLCCYILYIISLYISVCFITLMFRFKSDIQEVGFQSSCPNSALSADFPWTWKLKHSVLSTRFLCRVQCMRTSLLLVRHFIP